MNDYYSQSSSKAFSIQNALFPFNPAEIVLENSERCVFPNTKLQNWFSINIWDVTSPIIVYGQTNFITCLLYCPNSCCYSPWDMKMSVPEKEVWNEEQKWPKTIRMYEPWLNPIWAAISIIKHQSASISSNQHQSASISITHHP